jgi:xanthine/uracil permease
VALTPKERRFARQILAVGVFVFVLSWFRVVSPMAGRIALAIGVFGGGIARGFDGPPDRSPTKPPTENN